MRLIVTTALCLACALAPAATAAPDKAAVEALIGQAQQWLLAQQQPSGAFLPGNRFAVGITAMTVELLSRPPAAIPADDARIAKAIAFLKAKTQPDGGVYDPEEGLGNYGTSFALMAAAAAQVPDQAWIEGMQRYLRGIQNTEEGDQNIANGGIGYGSQGKGHEDLSNTSTAVQALRASGVKADDPALQRALKFMERCQNLSSVNKLPWAGNDGSAVYSPDESKAVGSWSGEKGGAGTAGGEGTAGGAAPAGEEAKAAMTGYGSMTYALLSSYLALDLKADDPRVKAALDWVTRNYTLDANPGMQKGHEREGLFYYYAAMAKTFGILGMKEVTLADGTTRDWRGDLFGSIKAAAMPTEGAVSWMNSEKRWGESLPQLATIYMLRALKSIDASL